LNRLSQGWIRRKVCSSSLKSWKLEVVIDSVPMLKKLTLKGLKKSESIARPSSVWNKETMP
jgi:hypothetical protein